MSTCKRLDAGRLHIAFRAAARPPPACLWPVFRQLYLWFCNVLTVCWKYSMMCLSSVLNTLFLWFIARKHWLFGNSKGEYVLVQFLLILLLLTKDQQCVKRWKASPGKTIDISKIYKCERQHYNRRKGRWDPVQEKKFSSRKSYMLQNDVPLVSQKLWYETR